MGASSVYIYIKFCVYIYVYIYTHIHISFYFYPYIATYMQAFQVVLVIKKPPANEGDLREAGSIPGLGRSPGGGHGNPLQYSCLENLIDKGAWWATVHEVAKSQI